MNDDMFKKAMARMANDLKNLIIKEVTDTMPRWRHGTPPHKGGG